MKTLVLLLIYYLCFCTNDVHTSKCISVRGERRLKEVLAEKINSAYNLAYYKHKNLLFFSYNVGNDNEDTFQMAYLDTKKKNIHLIDIPNGFAAAIDEENHHIYLGGSSGIYKFNVTSNKTHLIDNKNVWSMFHKKHLYFIGYPTQKLYKVVHKGEKYEVERVTHIHEKIYQYAIDGKYNQYFTNNTGLYRIENGTDIRKRYETDETSFRCIVIHKGEAYFCGRHKIFVPTKEHKLEEIAKISNLFGLTFNENNIIYASATQIVEITSHC